MSVRLIYLMGPSGSGKDSVLGWLRARLDPRHPVHWARRTITRPVQAGGERHESIDSEEFAALKAQGEFALAWQANRLYYGIRQHELAPLACGQWVLVNGSRAYLDEALVRFPDMTVVQITARAETLRRRLAARGRESPEEVEERVARASTFRLPPGVQQVNNDEKLDQAGHDLLSILQALEGWTALPPS